MIYEIDKSRKQAPRPLGVSSLSDQGWREKDLENYLFEHLRELLSTDLMVIGQSKPGEKADLVALDREGELWLFELKKAGGQSENLLQVMRYSQIFGAFEIGDLDALYRDSHTGATKSIAVAFCEWFGYDSNRAVEWGEKLGKRHHLVIVTDGTDDASLNAVAHWQRHGLDVQAWPFRIYKGSSQAFSVSASEESFGSTGTLLRETKCEVVLVFRLRAALEGLNPTLPPEAITAAGDKCSAVQNLNIP